MPVSEPIDDAVICPLCTELLCEPVTLPCGDTCCQSCLLESFAPSSVSRKCPVGCDFDLPAQMPGVNPRIKQRLLMKFRREYAQRLQATGVSGFSQPPVAPLFPPPMFNSAFNFNLNGHQFSSAGLQNDSKPWLRPFLSNWFWAIFGFRGPFVHSFMTQFNQLPNKWSRWLKDDFKYALVWLFYTHVITGIVYFLAKSMVVVPYFPSFYDWLSQSPASDAKWLNQFPLHAALACWQDPTASTPCLLLDIYSLRGSSFMPEHALLSYVVVALSALCPSFALLLFGAACAVTDPSLSFLLIYIACLNLLSTTFEHVWTWAQNSAGRWLLSFVYTPLKSSNFNFNAMNIATKTVFVVPCCVADIIVSIVPFILLPSIVIHLSFYLSPFTSVVLFYYLPYLLWLGVYLSAWAFVLISPFRTIVMMRTRVTEMTENMFGKNSPFAALFGGASQPSSAQDNAQAAEQMNRMMMNMMQAQSQMFSQAQAVNQTRMLETSQAAAHRRRRQVQHDQHIDEMARAADTLD